MSDSYEVFIKTGRSLSEIAAGLSEFTGVRFERFVPQDEPDEEVCSAQAFGHRMSLYDTQGFEDNKELAFTQYQLCVSIDRSGILKRHPEYAVWHEQVARMLACDLTNVYAAECVVMFNVERVVARYP